MIREDFFDFTETETAAMIQPDRMTDNDRRETMVLVADRFGRHVRQSAKSPLT